MLTPCVIAVVVTYHPNQAALERLLQQLATQVQHTVVIDNTEANHQTLSGLRLSDKTTLLRFGRNMGIGFAQNQGVEEARCRGATHVLLMDQDSLPSTAMVPTLLQALALAPHQRIAAIGPVCRDVKTGCTTALIRRQGWRIRRITADGLTKPVQVEYIPASGTLIPLPMWDKVGPVKAEYFIDKVDMEWCLRARQLGLEIWVEPRIAMQHDQATRALSLLGRTLYVGHDFRAYFHVRNSVAMALRATIPTFWRWDQLLKTLPYALFYTAVAEHGKLLMARQLAQAVWDGIRNRTGLGLYDKKLFKETDHT